MSVETDLFDALKTLVANRVYPDVGPFGGALPYVTFQQVGGEPVNFLAGLPSQRNGRFQVNAWAGTRLAAMVLIRQIEDAVRASVTLRAVTLGGAVAVFEQDTKLHGARQDFSIWFAA